jgi:tRNA (cytidine/uridine-2'-O-)-methyltransferase
VRVLDKLQDEYSAVFAAKSREIWRKFRKFPQISGDFLCGGEKTRKKLRNSHIFSINMLQFSAKCNKIPLGMKFRRDWMLNIVLVEPEIPQNCGNIARTCAATGSVLHLIKPLGFDISDKAVKRAGLDYWHLVDVRVYENLAEFFAKNPEANFWLLSTKAPQAYHEVSFQDGDYLLFGKETKGLPEDLLYGNEERCLRIPMREEARSLNLSNAVALTTYEALRQLDFPHLEGQGKMKFSAEPKE